MVSTKEKMFYGWWIVIGGFILNFIGIGIAFNTLGVFFKPVVESRHFNRGDFSLYFTIAALSMTFAAPVVGKLIEKFDIRIVTGACTALLAISFASFSQCSTLSHFYLVSVLAGIGHAGSHIIPVSTMINNWFQEKRGLAMGIVYTATGFGGLLFNPLGNWLIQNYGWRQTYIILGILIGITSTPTAIILMRKTPREMGLLPYGSHDRYTAAETETGLNLGDFVKTKVFWMLALMIFFLNTLNAGIQQHLIPYLTDIGHSATFAANIMALYLGMTVAGKLILGQITDKRGLTEGLMLFSAILGAGIGILFGANLALVAVLFGIVYGVGNALQTVMPPLMTAECAGLKHFASIYGIMAIFQTLGAGLGMPLSGYLFDWRGDYYLSFWLYILMAASAAACGFLALRGNKSIHVRFKS